MGRSVIDLDHNCSNIYAEERGGVITSVRIYRLEGSPFGSPSASDDDDPELPWQMDGIDMLPVPPRVTELVWNFTSFESAIASAPAFITHFTLVPRPPQ